jgi:hypothetical protein
VFGWHGPAPLRMLTGTNSECFAYCSKETRAVALRFLLQTSQGILQLAKFDVYRFSQNRSRNVRILSCNILLFRNAMYHVETHF